MSHLQTIQTFSDFVEVVTQVQKNPKFLQEAAEQAYTLGKQGEDRLKAAHETIAAAQDYLAQHEAAKKELSDIGDALEVEKAKLKSAKEEHAAEIAKHFDNVTSLAQSVESFKKEKLEHEKSISALDKQAKQIDLYHKSVIEREQDLITDRAKLDAYKSELDAKADHLKSLETKIKNILG